MNTELKGQIELPMEHGKKVVIGDRLQRHFPALLLQSKKSLKDLFTVFSSRVLCVLQK